MNIGTILRAALPSLTTLEYGPHGAVFGPMPKELDPKQPGVYECTGRMRNGSRCPATHMPLPHQHSWSFEPWDADAESPHRYVLWRQIPDKQLGLDRAASSFKLRLVLFMLLNPSTASHIKWDNTLGRCIGFGQELDTAHIAIVNPFAYRLTESKDLPKVPRDQAIGACNDEVIRTVIQTLEPDLLIAGWGPPGRLYGRDREMIELLRSLNQPIHALKETASGAPGHPLYLKKNLRPFPYEPRR